MFNKALRHSRTIVEIMFGNFQRHRFMSGSGFSVETVCILFHLMFEMEKIKYDLREEEMHPTKGRVVNLEERMKTLAVNATAGGRRYTRLRSCAQRTMRGGMSLGRGASFRGLRPRFALGKGSPLHMRRKVRSHRTRRCCTGSCPWRT